MIIVSTKDGELQMAVSGDLNTITADYILIGHQLFDELSKKSNNVADAFKELVRSSALSGVMFDTSVEEAQDYVPFVKAVIKMLDEQMDIDKDNPLRGATEW